MGTKAEERRRDLHARIIDIAQAQIADQGVKTIKARDLAKEADYSVGAIHNVLGNLNNIVTAANGRTFQALGAHVAAALKGKQAHPPPNSLS